MNDPSSADDARRLIESHPRIFEANRYVYPVLSRRAGGISIGVNLNLDKICNFSCAYCQVDRAEMGSREFLGLDRLADELNAAVELVTSGRLFEEGKFAKTPPDLRRLNDFALSGDGEPTAYRNFEDVVSVCAEVRRRHGLDDVKLVLITNASMLHRENVRRGLEMLDANGGEIWAKLDAGTEEHFRRIARSRVSLERILDNLTATARARPIVIQSMFLQVEGSPPSVDERQAYCDRLNEITAAGGRIKLVQLYTVARPPAESWVGPLDSDELESIAELVRRRTGLTVATF